MQGGTQHAAFRFPQSFQVLSDCFEPHYSWTQTTWSCPRKYQQNQLVGWLILRFWHRPLRASYTTQSAAASHQTLYTDQMPENTHFSVGSRIVGPAGAFGQGVFHDRVKESSKEAKPESSNRHFQEILVTLCKITGGGRLEGTFGDHLVQTPAQTRLSCTRLPKTLHKEV